MGMYVSQQLGYQNKVVWNQTNSLELKCVSLVKSACRERDTKLLCVWIVVKDVQQ
jgi:hypothetical protein